jgi:hypothetical protein
MSTSPENSPPETAEDAVNTERQQQTVKIENLKALRTKTKIKLTNICKKLCTAVEANLECRDIFLEMESCMSNFNDACEDYACMIECNDFLKDYSIVNGLDLDAYQEAGDKVYHSAKLQYFQDAQSKHTGKLQYQINVHSKRLENLCTNIDRLLSSPDCDVHSLRCYRQDLEFGCDQLLRTMEELSGSSNDSSSNEDLVSKLVAHADELKRQCSVREQGFGRSAHDLFDHRISHKLPSSGTDAKTYIGATVQVSDSASLYDSSDSAKGVPQPSSFNVSNVKNDAAFLPSQLPSGQTSIKTNLQL